MSSSSSSSSSGPIARPSFLPRRPTGCWKGNAAVWEGEGGDKWLARQHYLHQQTQGLQNKLAQVTKTSKQRVAETMRCCSRNHIRAMARRSTLWSKRAIRSIGKTRPRHIVRFLVKHSRQFSAKTGTEKIDRCGCFVLLFIIYWYCDLMFGIILRAGTDTCPCKQFIHSPIRESTPEYERFGLVLQGMVRYATGTTSHVYQKKMMRREVELDKFATLSHKTGFSGYNTGLFSTSFWVHAASVENSIASTSVSSSEKSSDGSTTNMVVSGAKNTRALSATGTTHTVAILVAGTTEFTHQVDVCILFICFESKFQNFIEYTQRC